MAYRRVVGHAAVHQEATLPFHRRQHPRDGGAGQQRVGQGASGHAYVLAPKNVGGHNSGYYDVALRDFGLLLGALALARLASKYDPPGLLPRLRSDK
jgi:hypothetical protein